MRDEDFLRLLVVAGISAGMTPKYAIATAYETVRLMGQGECNNEGL